MIVDIINDEYETITTRIICPYHKDHPGKTWAGCTCRILTEQRKVKTKNKTDITKVEPCLEADL